MINIVSYSTAKGSSGTGGSGGSSVTNYNNYTGIQPLYLWGNYFDGTSDIEGDITSNGTIKGNDLEANNSIIGKIAEVLSATTEYFKTITLDATGDASISGNTSIHQNLSVDGSTNIGGNTIISGSTSMTGDLYSGGSARIGGNVNISGSTFTEGSSTVHHDMTVGGDGIIYGHSTLSGGTTTTNIQSENITNTGTIKTKDLEVTGSAHFFELIIDKIKAAGGAILLTPADGFKIDIVENVANGKKLYFRSTDNSGKGIMNMWKVNDQAICQSFNQATVGVQYEVSNKYWWSLVTDVSEQPVQKTVSGETNDYHYITISTRQGYDSENRPYYDGTVNVEVGDEVAMLGYRGTDDQQRQSATYMAAYRSLDLGLTAPLFAEYKGIDDFNLASHRMSYIDANGAKFVGGLYVDSSTSVQDYITNETTEIRNEFKFDIDGLTSKVEHKSRPNIIPNNDWHDQDTEPLYQENDELYEVSGTTECTAYPPVMYLNKGTYTPSIYGYGKFKTIVYGYTKDMVDGYIPVETMINYEDTWNGLPRSQAIFIAPVDGYYGIGVELMDSSYSGDTEYYDYIEDESSGSTSGDTVQTTISLSVDDVKINRTKSTSVNVYPEGYNKIIYRSSNPTVISVDEYGNIHGNGSGNAVIYAIANEAYSGGYHYLPSSDYKTVQCTENSSTQIEITLGELVQTGQTYTITTEITPSDYPGTISFKSSNTSIATVNGNQLTVLGSGNFTLSGITETITVDGYTWYGNSTIKQMEATEYNIEQTTCGISLVSNEIYTMLTTNASHTYYPSFAQFVLSSSDESVATVTQNGIVSGITEGECDIIITIPTFVYGNTMYQSSSASTHLHVAQIGTSDLNIIINGSSQPCSVSGNTEGNVIRPGDSLNEINWGYSPIEYPESGITLTSNYSEITPTLTATTVSDDFRVSKFTITVPEHLERESFQIPGQVVTWYRPKKPVINLSGNDMIITSGGTQVYVNGDQNTLTVDFKPYRIDFTCIDGAYVTNDWGNGEFDYCDYYTATSGYTEFLATPTKIPSNCFIGSPVNVDMSDLETVLSADNIPFENEEYLTSIVLPPNLRNISNGMFRGCYNLEYINIGNSVTSIEEIAFLDCISLESINIPSGVTTIGQNAFKNCISLESINIPSGVTTIYSSTFSGCSGITEVNISSNSILSTDYSTSNNLSSIFGNKVEKYTIGEGVTRIGNNAFYAGTLNTVSIPSTLNEIGNSSFRGCNNLKKVIIQDIGSWCNVTIPTNESNPLKYSHKIYSDENTEIKHLVIPEGVTTINKNAFLSCSGVTTVTISSTVTESMIGAFRNCNGLTKTIISDIDSWCETFVSGSTANPINYSKNVYSDENTEIKNLVISEGVTKIGHDTFYNCIGLSSVVIPNSVTSIGESAFYKCGGLTSVTIGSGTTNIGRSCFYGCNSLSDVTINATTPPNITNTSFGLNGIETLHVPAQSVSAYQEILNYSRVFYNIVAIQ